MHSHIAHLWPRFCCTAVFPPMFSQQAVIVKLHNASLEVLVFQNAFVDGGSVVDVTDGHLLGLHSESKSV